MGENPLGRRGCAKGSVDPEMCASHTAAPLLTGCFPTRRSRRTPWRPGSQTARWRLWVAPRAAVRVPKAAGLTCCAHVASASPRRAAAPLRHAPPAQDGVPRRAGGRRPASGAARRAADARLRQASKCRRLRRTACARAGIFKSAAVEVLRRERRLMTTGHITRCAPARARAGTRKQPMAPLPYLGRTASRRRTCAAPRRTCAAPARGWPARVRSAVLRVSRAWAFATGRLLGT